jgi:hypothetical protein
MIGDSTMNRPFRDELHKALVACLGQPVATPPRTATSDRNAQRKALAILWLFFVALWTFALASLYSAWLGFGPDDWWWFWVPTGVSLLFGDLHFISALYTIWRVHHPGRSTTEAPQLSVRTRRAAVLSADDTLAPLVMNLAIPDAPVVEPSMASDLRVLPAWRKSLLITAAMLVPYSLFWRLYVIWQLTAPLSPHSVGHISWQALLFFSWTLALAIWGSISALGAPRPFRVRADIDGLRWREGWSKKLLRWQDMRGWCVPAGARGST